MKKRRALLVQASISQMPLRKLWASKACSVTLACGAEAVHMVETANQDGSIPDSLKDWAVPEHVGPLVNYIGNRESGNRYNVLQSWN